MPNNIDEMIDLRPDSSFALMLECSNLYDKGEFKEALECLDKINPEKIFLAVPVFGLYGSVLCELNRFEEAIQYYEKIIAIEPKNSLAWISKGKAYYKLGNRKEAINSFIKSKEDILNILIRIDEKDRDVISLDLKLLLDNDAFFQNIIQAETNNLDIYKEVYILSMLIVSRLQMQTSVERFVSHYTKRDVMESMLIKSSKFRLSAVDTTNDPKEGITLIDYLFDTRQGNEIIEEEPENYSAFTGSFTFNHDSLNQFRLYGKEDDKECTGVSIVFKNSFFRKETKKIAMPLPNSHSGISKQQTEKDKYPLFRCLYLDPVTGFVNSLGYKEEYLFYRKQDGEKEDFIKDIGKYMQYINGNLKYIRERMKELKGKTNGLSPVVVNKLLLHLRYLTKHISFKEEQECRIIEILHSDDKKIFTMNDRKYIEYLNIKSHVKKIYFGPVAKNIESYQDKILNNGLSIRCRQSDHPFVLRTTKSKCCLINLIKNIFGGKL